MTISINLSDFDDVEVMPVWEDPDDGTCEPVPDAPHTATFWTVYGHRKEGGVTALIDCADEQSADAAAFVLEQALLVPELLAALSFCEMTLWDLEASRQKGYIERARSLAGQACKKANEGHS